MPVLKMVSQKIVESLSSSVPVNIERYRGKGFADQSADIGWNIDVPTVAWDDDIPMQLSLDGEDFSDLESSQVVYSALKGMTPAIARDERIWIRLCHVELFDYSKARWMKSEGLTEESVAKHFFASGVPGARDHNSIGRLWWNAHVASLAFPSDVRRGLECLLGRANIRKQVIERADSAFRPALAGPLLSAIEGNAWIRENDRAVALFMKRVNRRFGGVILEDVTREEIEAELAECLAIAEAHA